MTITFYKATVFIQNLYAKFFGKNFSVKSTIFLFFRDQMCTKFVFSEFFFAKTSFLDNFFVFSGPNVHYWVQSYSFYPKFVHFGEIFWQNSSFYPKFVHFGEIFWQKLHF